MKTQSPKRVPVADDDELLRRALAAYFRAGANVQPGRTSGVRKLAGKSYVVLKAGNRTLAVYRYRTTGLLRALKRWPSELVD
jgi:hypothetical protein